MKKLKKENCKTESFQFSQQREEEEKKMKNNLIQFVLPRI